MAHYSLDAKGLLCPIPVIRTQDRIQELQPGDTLDVYCTDPGATNDIPAWCRINGHLVKEIHQDDREIVITVEVGTN